MNKSQNPALEIHKKFGGKITTSLRDEPTPANLKLYYTPGVADVSREVAANEQTLRDYTWVNNLVAVISDGSAVLGLGDIGPKGALPVMEGKAMLLKHFADVDSVPIVLDVHSADEIVNVCKAIAPSFGGINLEDIAAPICFEVEDRLKRELDIPVMHDDQHGTAIVVLAGLINAAKVTNRSLKNCKVVVIGAGAAGVAIAKLLYDYAKPQIIAVDSKGIVSPNRQDLTPEKIALADMSKPKPGSLQDALKDADVIIGVSRAGMLKPADIKLMAEDAIVFAMANPEPEILPNVAKKAGAAVVATGRSDFPNQVNNALAFPGIFRGALDNNVKTITDVHKIAAAEAIAKMVKNPSGENVIPSVFEKNLVKNVANVIR